ncbi:MAG TPA: glycosyl hydrolase family 28-related protein [Armatimonadota bacterium]|jgi:hypothetical protein
MKLCYASLICAVLLGAGPVRAEEFVGPFPSWANAVRDYGAKGDGIADDTAALQQAFDELGQENKPAVLYLPAGTYRLTSTLTMATRTGISILGEDPATTMLRWDGPQDGTMAWFNGVAYSSWGRLTWDGAGRAKCAVDHGWEGKQPNATTHNEHADEVFQDVGFGIRGGSRGFMDAETSILRCKFYRCTQAAVSIENFNALDWFVWYSLFEDCRVGVTNTFGAGNFCVYNSVFRRSKVADLTIGNLGYFSFRNNYSEGSKAFFVASGMSAGALLTFQENTVVNAQDATPIQVGNLGPVVLLDNRIFTPGPGPAVQVGQPTLQADLFSMGNRFSVAEPLRCWGRTTSVDDLISPSEAAEVVAPELPPTPPNRHRPVIEVPVGAAAAAIQEAIAEAAIFKGQRPVVHFPKGVYSVERTVTVPAGCDVQLVGDGLLGQTLLQKTGADPGPVLYLAGPSRALLRHLHLRGTAQTDGLVVGNCDQPGGRIFAQGASVPNATQVGVLVDGVENADVSLHDFYHAGAPVSFRVVGGVQRAAGKEAPGRVCMFSGATSDSQVTWDVQKGGRVLAQDLWYETNRWPLFIRPTGSGEIYYQGGNIAVSAKDDARALIDLNGFAGRLTMLSGVMASVSPLTTHVAIGGDGAKTEALFLGCQRNNAPADAADAFFQINAPGARVGLLHNRNADQTGATFPVPDAGVTDSSFLREMLSFLRRERPKPINDLPAGVTDVRLYRIFVEGSRIGIRLEAGE